MGKFGNFWEKMQLPHFLMQNYHDQNINILLYSTKILQYIDFYLFLLL